MSDGLNDASEVRTRLHEGIQGTVGVDETLPEGAMLLGWVAVAEWMSPDGKRWLSIVDGDSNREGLAAWQRQGYLHNALFDPEGFVPDEDDP